MKALGFGIVLLVPGLIQAQGVPERSVQQKFISGAEIRMHLEASGYTISAGDGENIRVTCQAGAEEQLKGGRVAIKQNPTKADVYISNTPNNNFKATIEVPRRSDL